MYRGWRRRWRGTERAAQPASRHHRAPRRYAAVGALCVAGVCTAAQPAAEVRPFGAWPSPISAQHLLVTASRYSDIQVDGAMPYWVETRPREGRSVAMRRLLDGRIETLTPSGFDVRTRVHEYGGKALLAAGGVIYFTNHEDQQLYRQRPAEAPRALTRVRGTRYADCAADSRRTRLICIREDHRAPGGPRNELVAVALGAPGDAEVQVLFAGSDFVSDPAISEDGTRIAFLTWNYPDMPWDHATLWVARLGSQGELSGATAINAGIDEAPLGPEWGPDGALYFVSDRDEWWNLYRWSGTAAHRVSRARMDLGMPPWYIGRQTYALAGDGRILSVCNDRGTEGVGIVDPESGRFERLPLSIVSAQSPALAGERAYLEVGFRDRPHALVELNLRTRQLTTVRAPADRGVGAEFVSRARPIEFATGSHERAHAFYYSPANPGMRGPPGLRPPLIVVAHGGPTFHSTPALNLSLQYWTSRGFAVLDVNYRGSTGFGRAYRRSLYGRWGEADVEDVVNGARRLAAEGLVDPDRLVIRGASAGGLTTLAALAFHEVFRAGTVYFGVSDLEALRRDTHKFESRYFDSLVGPYPQQLDRYRARSPINHLGALAQPLLLIQGAEDRVVVPSQSQRIVVALSSRGTPVAYLEFAGEGHGLVNADAIVRARQAELYFYGRVLGFEPAEPLPAIEIVNGERLGRGGAD